MTLVMAEKNQPMFRDFLGLGHTDEVKQVGYTSSDVIHTSRTSPEFDSEGDGETTATRASSGTSGRFKTTSVPGLVSPSFCLALPSSSDPGSVNWRQAQTTPIQHHGNRSAFYKLDVESPQTAKKRDSPPNRESLQDRLVEVLECSRPPKVARNEHTRPDKRIDPGELAPTSDNLHLSMQPPRVSNKSPTWFQQTSKHETPGRHTKKLEHARPSQINTGVSMRGLSHIGSFAERAERAERAPPTVPRENITSSSPQLAQPAADEGSRSGLKGSLLAGLLDSAGLLHDPSNPTPAGSSGGPPLSGRQPKLPSGNGGSDPIPPSRQAPPASKQLTIFYGGQAHVFDDVPQDKADAIMALAGSNGRSWSTTYSPQTNAKVTNSSSDCSLSALEREKEGRKTSLYKAEEGA